MKRVSTITLSLIFFLLGVCFVGCGKTTTLPDGNYVFLGENDSFQRTDEDVRNTCGWVINGDTAEFWTSSLCEYKAKIVEKEGEILFDGYRWREITDLLFGDGGEQGSNHDYTIVYDEAAGIISLTAKLPQENVEYVFDNITFVKSSGLRVEDLSRYIPFTHTKEVKTVKDFEKLILDNLETYRLQTHENGTNKEIYFTPKYYSITIKTEDTLSLRYEKEGEAKEVSCVRLYADTRWAYTTDWENFVYDSASTISYAIEFPLDDNALYFRAVYNYKIK